MGILLDRTGRPQIAKLRITFSALSISRLSCAKHKTGQPHSFAFA